MNNAPKSMMITKNANGFTVGFVRGRFESTEEINKFVFTSMEALLGFIDAHYAGIENNDLQDGGE